jgi:hypothetical protein
VFYLWLYHLAKSPRKLLKANKEDRVKQITVHEFLCPFTGFPETAGSYFWGEGSFFFFFLIAVQEFELRALHLLGRCSTTGVSPQPFLIWFLWRYGYT